MATDVIVLSEELLPELIEKLIPHQLYGLIGSIRVSLTGKRKIAVYTDGWPEFTTVLVEPILPEFHSDFVFLFTTDYARCKRFLLTNSYIDWKNKNYGVILPERVGVEKLFMDIKQKVFEEIYLYHFNKDCLPKTEVFLPSGYHESQLKMTDAAVVVSNWKYSDSGTQKYIEFMIDNLATICIRDDNGVPVGWMLQYPFLSIGMLHVLETHRGHGLGKYMIQNLSKQLVDKGETPYVYIMPENKQSVKIHEQCGYKNTGIKIVWIPTVSGWN